MRLIRLLCPAALLIALSACARIASNVPHSYALTSGSNNGLAVFSFTGEGSVQMILFVRREGEKSSTVVAMRPHGVPGDWNTPAKGRLIVMELNAGEYEIHQWRGFQVESAEHFSIPFTVQEGRATYIGNVHIEVGRSRYGIGVVDQSRRDVPLFLSRYPEISREAVDIRLSRLRDTK